MVDCKDQSGPLNTWTGNVGQTAEPRAICAVPTVDNHPDHHGKDHTEAQEAAPQEDQEAQAAPPGPVQVHAPLALVT